MTSSTRLRQYGETVDLAIVGAGIVGLAHAVDAVSRGLSVAIFERDERAVGASVRNFGHCCITAQSGAARRYAIAARPIWLRLAKEAGFWATDAGTIVVARADDEYTVLEEFRAARPDEIELLGAAEVRGRVPLGDAVVGGAWLPADIRVDPRAATAAIARWLAEQGVRFHFDTAVWGIEAAGLVTSRGEIRARHTVVAVGHDVDRHYPDLAAAAGLQRCSLHMLRVRPARPVTIDPAVFTGFSLLRYDGFAVGPTREELRTRLHREHPELVAAGLNLMLTQLPDGDLTIGDTHAYSRTVTPFADERLDELVRTEIAALLGTDALAVQQRWLGVYAAATEPFLIAAPQPSVRVVSVTSGVGMTTALGLAPEVLDDLLA